MDFIFYIFYILFFIYLATSKIRDEIRNLLL